jgi:hypothetical protein
VVSVGDVAFGNVLERRLETGDFQRIVHHPQRVSDAVSGDELRGGVADRPMGYERVDHRMVAVGEKHRTGVRADRIGMAGAVILLVRPGVLVFLDPAFEVVADRDRSDDAGLDVLVHPLPVEVERRSLVANEPALPSHRSKFSPALA